MDKTTTGQRGAPGKLYPVGGDISANDHVLIDTRMLATHLGTRPVQQQPEVFLRPITEIEANHDPVRRQRLDVHHPRPRPQRDERVL